VPPRAADRDASGRRGNRPLRVIRWSEVARAADADPAVRREALASLLDTYLPALATYLRRHRGIPPDRVDDLVQGFVCDKVVADELFAYADLARGQFRLFVLKSLERYVRRAHRYESAAKRRPDDGQALVRLDDDDDDDANPAAPRQEPAEARSTWRGPGR
jgi:hypothetical protein